MASLCRWSFKTRNRVYKYDYELYNHLTYCVGDRPRRHEEYGTTGLERKPLGLLFIIAFRRGVRPHTSIDAAHRASVHVPCAPVRRAKGVSRGRADKLYTVKETYALRLTVAVQYGLVPRYRDTV